MLGRNAGSESMRTGSCSGHFQGSDSYRRYAFGLVYGMDWICS